MRPTGRMGPLVKFFATRKKFIDCFLVRIWFEYRRSVQMLVSQPSSARKIQCKLGEFGKKTVRFRVIDACSVRVWFGNLRSVQVQLDSELQLNAFVNAELQEESIAICGKHRLLLP